MTFEKHKSTVTMTSKDGKKVITTLEKFEEMAKKVIGADAIETKEAWVKKIKLVSGEPVLIWTESEIGPNDTVSSCFKSKEDPHYSFTDAMYSLAPFVRLILEVPFDWAEELIVTSVIFSRHTKSGVKGAVMAGQAKLETAGAPFTFSTPHLPFDQYKEDGEAKLMPVEVQIALNFLESQAVDFLNGKRAQGELFGEAA